MKHLDKTPGRQLASLARTDSRHDGATAAESIRYTAGVLSGITFDSRGAQAESGGHAAEALICGWRGDGGDRIPTKP